MRSRLAKISLFLLVVAASAAWAAGASLAGTWTGTVDVHDAGSGADISVPLTVQFEEAQAGVVKGSIGREGDANVPLRNGKLEGDLLTFEAASEETSGPVKFRLTVAGERMSGDMQGAIEVEPIVGKVKLSRQK